MSALRGIERPESIRLARPDSRDSAAIAAAIRLGNAARSTLGHMPFSAYSDAADKQTLLLAFADDVVVDTPCTRWHAGACDSAISASIRRSEEKASHDCSSRTSVNTITVTSGSRHGAAATIASARCRSGSRGRRRRGHPAARGRGPGQRRSGSGLVTVRCQTRCAGIRPPGVSRTAGRYSNPGTREQTYGV